MLSALLQLELCGLVSEMHHAPELTPAASTIKLLDSSSPQPKLMTEWGLSSGSCQGDL